MSESSNLFADGDDDLQDVRDVMGTGEPTSWADTIREHPRVTGFVVVALAVAICILLAWPAEQQRIPPPVWPGIVSGDVPEDPHVSIYVYPLEHFRMFNQDLYDSVSKQGDDVLQTYWDSYGGERIFMNRLLKDTAAVVSDPQAADLFWVPYWSGANVLAGKEARISDTRAFDQLYHQMRFWGRNGGVDHIFYLSHDFGGCESSTRGDAMRAGMVAPFMRRGIVASSFGSTDIPKCFQRGLDIVLPPALPAPAVKHALDALHRRGIYGPLVAQEADLALVEDDKLRSNLLFYRGGFGPSMDGILEALKVVLNAHREDFGLKDISVARPYFDNATIDDALSAHFCLSPARERSWSPMPFVAAAAGCIPVIVSDDILLPWERDPELVEYPFPGWIEWDTFSVRVSRDEIGSLYDKLVGYNEAQRMKLRAELFRMLPRLLLLEERLSLAYQAWGEQDAYDWALQAFAHDYNHRVKLGSIDNRAPADTGEGVDGSASCQCEDLQRELRNAQGRIVELELKQANCTASKTD